MSLTKYYQTCGTPKPTPRKKLKARLDRAEAKVAAWCRAQCVERDGACRVHNLQLGGVYDFYTDHLLAEISLTCEGPSAWCHLPIRRRSKTRNMDPTYRHDPKFTLMLCQRLHDMLDGRELPKLIITALSRKGCNGPLKFRRAK